MNNEQVKSAQGTISLCRNVMLLLAVGMYASMIPDFAFAAAATSDALTDTFCNIVGLLTGATGKAIATIAIIIVGIGALLGKISWGMALIVAVGVALVFGADTIVTALGATSATSCGATFTPFS